jgi:predicted protein tyrosine phosphatase
MKQPPYLVSICGKYEVERFATSNVTHLLSLEDPGTPKDTPAWFNGPHVQLHFHDVDRPGEASATGSVPPAKGHVTEILRVGAGCLEAATKQRVHLLVHCYAGISRSTAAAFAIVAQAVGVERAVEALEFVLEKRPEAFPNPLIVQHADRLLQADGRLVDALQPLRDQFSQAIDDWLGRRGGR